MKDALLIYNRSDYAKNAWFAKKLQDVGIDFGFNIKLVFADELQLFIFGGDLSITYRHKKLEKTYFVINRTRDARIAYHFEALGIRVFNSSNITEVCNNKARTHQVVNSLGVKSINTLLCNKSNLINYDMLLHYPLVLKSVNGHGGNEVFKVHNQTQLLEVIAKIPTEEFIIQEFSNNCGIDIRVYIINNNIVSSVKRVADDSFKSNISMGGKSEPYELNFCEKEQVKKICSTLSFDFVGIDFILDEDENLLFNEVEDVVGCRALYANYSFDIVAYFMEYIAESNTAF